MILSICFALWKPLGRKKNLNLLQKAENIDRNPKRNIWRARMQQFLIMSTCISRNKPMNAAWDHATEHVQIWWRFFLCRLSCIKWALGWKEISLSINLIRNYSGCSHCLKGLFIHSVLFFLSFKMNLGDLCCRGKRLEQKLTTEMMHPRGQWHFSSDWLGGEY